MAAGPLLWRQLAVSTLPKLFRTADQEFFTGLPDLFQASSPPSMNLTLRFFSRSFSCTDLLTEPPRTQ
jgi:hypothetical protein